MAPLSATLAACQLPPRQAGERRSAARLEHSRIAQPALGRDRPGPMGLRNREGGWPRPAPSVRKSASARRSWSAARLFQQNAHRLLAAQAVPFIEWLLLETLQELREEKQDAVTQVELSMRSGLSERVVSYWFTMMSEWGLIDRGPDADGRAWRVILTELGEQTLLTCNERLEEAGLTG